MADRVRVRGIAIHRPLVYGNSAVVLTPKEREALAAADPSKKEHTHRWTVAVRGAASAPDSDIVGGADDISGYIKKVAFKLHETYANPNRTIDTPPFEVTETGWGEFDILIRITFVQDSGEKAASVYHHLKLHPWTASGEPEIPPIEEAIKMGPVHSWQYDEIVFNEPFNTFLETLKQYMPTPLPKMKRRPVPFHIANPASLDDTKTGTTPEFNQEMEKEEAEKLDKAKATLLAETEKCRTLLATREKELQLLRKKAGEL
ncbi:yeats family protein [Hymenopellis radicata]|nr:yeats family protein [Hymenopellis radicata]